jgi:hypothetical protein
LDKYIKLATPNTLKKELLGKRYLMIHRNYKPLLMIYNDGKIATPFTHRQHAPRKKSIETTVNDVPKIK